MIRRARIADAPRLLQLMRKLAEFEGYLDGFAVTEADLIERGLADTENPQFVAWVADRDDTLHAYAVAYVIPFTFDLRPTVVLKELYVEHAMRSRGYGHALLQEVVRYGRSLNARLLRWQVMPSNDAAKRFYRREGAKLDEAWENWILALDES